MSRDASAGQEAERSPPSWLFPVLLLIALQALFVWQDPAVLAERTLTDADGYTRLARIEALAEGSPWFDGSAVRANTPFGATLHWTRLFDVLVLAGAAPLFAFMSVKEALYWSGALINPLLHVASLIALMWAATPLVKRRHVAYLGVLALALPAVHSYFAVGRADHHGLILLLFVALMGVSVRLLVMPRVLRWFALAGVLAALMLWVSVESMVTIGIVLLGLALSWLVVARPGARENAVFALAMWAVLVVAFIIERPLDQYFVREYDRLSIVHIYVFLLPAVFWATLGLLERRYPDWFGPRVRWIVFLGGAAAAVAAVAIVVPRFFGGPYVGVDPRVIAVWQNTVQEVRSIVALDAPLRSLREFVFLMGHAVIALPILVWLLRRRDGFARGWWFISITAFVLVGLAFYQARWAAYAELILVVPYTVLLGAILDRVQYLYGQNALLVSAVRALTVAGFTCIFLIAGALLYSLEEQSQDSSAGACPLTAVASYLGDDAALSAEPQRLMTYIFDGPEVVYRSPHAVVGTPYERNADGILDTYDFFTARDDRLAHAIAFRRGIDLVLICAASREAKHYAGKPGSPTLHDRLRDADPPAWMVRAPLPESLANGYSMFRIIR